MTNQEKFIEIYQKHIHRPGADKFLEYLMSDQSDFFKHLVQHAFMALMPEA